MPPRWTMASIALVVAAVADLVLMAPLLVARVRRSQNRALAVVLLAAAWWAAAYAVEVGARDAATAGLAGAVKYLGIVAVPPAMLVFVLRVTGRDHAVRPWLPWALAVEPALVLGLLLTPATTDRFRPFDREAWPGPQGVEPTTLFSLHLGYSLGLLVIAVGVLVVGVARISPRYRPQAIGLMVGLTPPFVANLLFNVGAEPLTAMDLTPFALTASGAVLVPLLAAFPMFHLVPVARSAVVDAIDDAVVVLDADLVIVDVNPAATRLLGDDLLGRQAAGVLPALPAPGAAHDGSDHRRTSAVIDTRTGRRHLEVDLATVPANGGRPGHVVLMRDVTERRRWEARLEQLAHRDHLTGLPNRQLLGDRLERALAHARRHGELVGVLYLDLDRFKVVNDSLGHATGDELLVQVAERLRSELREDDTVARLGGDEFAVVLPGLSSIEEAALVAAKVLRSLATPFTAGGHLLYVTSSMGVAVHPEGGDDPATLLRHADAAMYRAKAGGKDRFELHADRPDGEDVARLRLEADLHLCLERDELELWYQPVVRVDDGAITGAEALLRWRHRERGLLLPGDFVPLAEESGRITPIGTWVLAAACREAIGWSGPAGPLDVAVNLSPVQLRHPALVADTAETLERCGIEPSRVVIELSERTIVDAAPAVLPALQGLKDLGVRLAVDDFGTGSTSLRLLKRLPLDVLKIDRLFVDDLADDPEDRAIVAATVQVAHTIGMRVVAEGVETVEQLDVLRELGCDEVQGYLLARPVPADEMARLAEAGALIVAG